MNTWRTWHRWISTLAGIFILAIALTGIWLQLDETYGIVDYKSKPPVQPPVMEPIDPVAQAQRAQAIVAKSRPGVAIVSMALDAKDGKPIAVVKYDGVSTPDIIDLDSGDVKAMPGPKPKTLKKRLRDLAMDIHTLRFVGIPGHVFGAIAGAALVFLGVSGLWMWWRMRGERKKRKQNSWLWR